MDRCEREPDQATAHNVRTTAHLVQALQDAQTLFVHVSTDYVFDGTKGSPYVESDAPRPLSVYGRSKVEGERVALRYPRAIIVRTSTLFGPGRANFCDYMISRLKAGETVEAFADQVTSPTYTADLAAAIGELGAALRRSWDAARPRVYHLVNAGGCSRVTFARRIADLLGCPRELIRAIAMADQQRPALRPAYSALASTQAPGLIGRTLRPWDEALQAYLRDR